MPERARSYCWTTNNPTEADINNLTHLTARAKYVIVGLEVGDNNTPHHQGYVHFPVQLAFSTIKAMLPRAHIEPCKGNPEQNIAYCSKQGNVIFEYGNKPRPGARNDIEHAIYELQNGANMKHITNTATSYQSIRTAEVWLTYNEEPRTWKPEVRWYYGPTGTGKTRTAREWLGNDIYTCLDTIKWFQGYDKHENVLIDDFRKDFCKFHQFLKLLDRYEYKVETKGGSRQFLARKIVITSPEHPEDIFNTREDVNQLLRRIDVIQKFGPDEEFVIPVTSDNDD